MPTAKSATLSRETAEALADELAFLDNYPRDPRLREAAGKHLQRICRGDHNYSALERATLLVREATATRSTWSKFGWPGMQDLYNQLFKPEPEFDLLAPKPGECEKCGSSGIARGVNGEFVCCGCSRGRFPTADELLRLNKPLDSFNPPSADPTESQSRSSGTHTFTAGAYPREHGSRRGKAGRRK